MHLREIFSVINQHHDEDYGHLSAHLTDDGSIEIHRLSSATGQRTVMQLGTVAVAVALDILTLSGQAHHTIVQRVADALDAIDEPLSVESMRKISQTLRMGVEFPMSRLRVGAGNVVKFRRTA